MRIRMSLRRTFLAALAAMMLALAVPTMASAASANDAFYKYTGSTPLSNYAPGTVLKSRTVPYHILGLATPLKAQQLLYRAIDAQGRPTVNVTSVVQPSCFLCLNREKVISYQSFYDSLNPLSNQQHNPEEHHHQPPNTAPDNQIIRASASEAKPSTIARVEEARKEPSHFSRLCR